jgi:tetratricopeptide (TPR) repeat protein
MKVKTERFSWFQVPEDIKHLLILAAENWENTSKSENYINQALAKTGDNLDVLVSAYRYFYYKNNYILAMQTATKVMHAIKISSKLPDNWQQLKPILLNGKQDPAIRLYLNAYASTGLVLAKMGQIEQAKKICIQIKEVDDKNEFGAAGILLDILTRPVED